MSQILEPSELAGIIGSNQTIRVDDGTIFTSRELEFIESTVMETDYQMTEGDVLVASDTSVPYYYESITYKRRRAGGLPIWVEGGPTQIPNVDTDVTEASAKYKQLVIGASWTQKELDASRAFGMALDASGASDAVQVLLTRMDDVKFEGDLSVGMRGWFDDVLVPREESAIGFNSNFTTTQIANALQDFINSIADVTNSVEAPNMLALSSTEYDYCANTPMSTDNSISILDQVLMNNGYITQRSQVARMTKLRSMTQGGVSVGNCAACYRLDPNKARVNVLPPTPDGTILRTGLSYVQLWFASISEVQHRKPKAASILTNVGRTS